jgi:uncharacterized protein YbbC (DUF1343 family)
MKRFLPGIDTLLARHPSWLHGRRVALVSHTAAVDACGRPTADRLHAHPSVRLVSLMGPEHGFAGTAGAGVACAAARHPDWRIPIHSLYGTTRQPTRAMLRQVDALVVDLQDLAVRCYTYVSTLRLVLESAADMRKEVIVLDRPVPLPNVVDGPVAQPGFTSFVGLTEGMPLVYGMTPGETARWLNRHLGLGVTLRVACMQGYVRQPYRIPDAPPWIPPSPGILSWESAMCYPATVFCEALPALDCGRRTTLPFQLLGAPWIRATELAEALNNRNLPGVVFHPHRYNRQPRETQPEWMEGVRITVTHPNRFRPVTASVFIIDTLQHLYGRRRVWRNSRPDWFDRLFATDQVRLALARRQTPTAIAASWGTGLSRYRKTRLSCLLYPRT